MSKAEELQARRDFLVDLGRSVFSGETSAFLVQQAIAGFLFSLAMDSLDDRLRMAGVPLPEDRRPFFVPD